MSEESNIPKGLIEKIQKLLNLKNDKAASQGEIENATAMITQLLLKHNLDMSTVERHAKGNERGGMAWTLNGKTNRHEGDWLLSLFGVICRFNLCECVLMDKRARGKDDMGYIVIIGRKVNVQIVYYIVDQLRVRISEMATNAWAVYRGDEKRNSYRRGYFRGVVIGINTRLAWEEIKRQQSAKDEENTASAVNSDKGLDYTNTNMGLMIRTEKEENEAFLKETIPDVKTKNQKKMISEDGLEHGTRDGTQMEIHRGLNAAKDKIK